MIITIDNIKTIYQRAMQYCVARYGSEPTKYLIINEDGSFRAIWYGHGSYADDEEVDFLADCLTADLDAVYAERKAAEEKKEKEIEAQRIKDQAAREKRGKEERKAQYEKLKKEFEV